MPSLSYSSRSMWDSQQGAITDVHRLTSTLDFDYCHVNHRRHRSHGGIRLPGEDEHISKYHQEGSS
ncbi:hypothetical protein EYF80_049395 [Liparis tanakae]|uniref:Uncharacterized protein n=1 Tax=Liparis tanakae TaxID=230148 RepID=A0A4Z2FHN2_9TELE|nr:hypothetical protein EYF80_049395 [Liparis tanakae]